MKAIEKIQTKDYIVNEIKREILSGNIPAGEELVQETIAEQLGVSRMPVREALQLLEQEGFLERLPNRHMQVSHIKAETIEAVFLALSNLETLIVSELHKNKKNLSAIFYCYNQYYENYETVGEEELIRMEMDLHKSFSETLENPYLLKIHHSMLKGYFFFARNLISGKNSQIKNAIDQFMAAITEFDEIKVEQELAGYFTYIATFLIQQLGE